MISWQADNVDKLYQQRLNIVINADKKSSVMCALRLVVLGLAALSDSISVYIGPSPREREKEERKDRESKNVQTTPTRTYCKAIGPCPTIIQTVGRPALEVYPGQSHHLTLPCVPCGLGHAITTFLVGKSSRTSQNIMILYKNLC